MSLLSGADRNPMNHLDQPVIDVLTQRPSCRFRAPQPLSPKFRQLVEERSQMCL